MQTDTHIPPAAAAEQFERRVAHDHFVRFHMGMILAAVVASGVLASKCLMALGISFRCRYPLAVLLSYAIFLGLVRIWIWYVSARAPRLLLAGFNWGGGGSGGSFSWGGTGGSGSSGGFSGFGGGTSGGGGASGSWEANEGASLISQPGPVTSGGGSHWWPNLDFGGGDDSDGWLVVVLLIALVTCILGGGIYLVYAAPHILPEAAWQVVLAGTLTRVSRQTHHNWMRGVIGSTWIPFVIVLLAAGALGWEAQHYCPTAHRLGDLLHCPAQ